MIGNQQEARELTVRQLREAVGLLSVGTFLEYFDLMIYVHMAVLINEFFFPQANPETAALYAASAFCSTFVFRPVGALIFGWIGDNIGRKVTVIITTFMMSISCVIMATLPTYAQIGITATVIMIICRIIQGMSSMGELMGAQLYLTEITKPPVQYSVVALIDAVAAMGSATALCVAYIITSFSLNWRGVFWIGAFIALIGVIARTALRETPEFANAKQRVKKILDNNGKNQTILKDDLIWHEKPDKKRILGLFVIDYSWPLTFYFAFIYCGNILKNQFGYTPEEVISHNFWVSIVAMINMLFIAYLSRIIYPLKILKIKILIMLIFIPFCPYILEHGLTTPFCLILLQLFFVVFGPSKTPAFPIFFRHFPVFQRFTYSNLSYAISRAIIYIITSFGIVYITKYFGNWGLLIIFIPIYVGYNYGLSYFEQLEKEAGNYP
ncbi:MFS transporter [Rickettsia rhipicephali]|uniref:MFS transporter n=1 Tax=Rickettsia rhipicephali TaxID=33992 RepID=UPI00070D6D92|nr:MFS transporter [Rickettsia rhipicephali]ALN41789.1 MFS transporter [Rickettsia rhipicephali]ALN41806.1 MFS transporter [Rickettsia rhipicephali]